MLPLLINKKYARTGKKGEGKKRRMRGWCALVINLPRKKEDKGHEMVWSGTKGEKKKGKEERKENVRSDFSFLKENGEIMRGKGGKKGKKKKEIRGGSRSAEPEAAFRLRKKKKGEKGKKGGREKGEGIAHKEKLVCLAG